MLLAVGGSDSAKRKMLWHQTVIPRRLDVRMIQQMAVTFII
jgi:hypothetical protein